MSLVRRARLMLASRPNNPAQLHQVPSIDLSTPQSPTVEEADEYLLPASVRRAGFRGVVPSLDLSGLLRESLSDQPDSQAPLRWRAGRRGAVTSIDITAIVGQLGDEPSDETSTEPPPPLVRRPAACDVSLSHDLLTMLPSRKLSARSASALGDRACAICCDDFQAEDDVACMPCDGLHSFHNRCISKWLYCKPQCPQCRWTASTPASLRGGIANANAYLHHTLAESRTE